MSEIRDPIFGFIEPDRDAWKILDTPLLQRLRRIKQLALANLVYPGALHTRFDHSIGVYYLSSKMAKKLLEKEKYKIEIVKLAALLHDVGHGPFSHVSESVLELFSRQPLSQDTTEKIHEKITARLLENDKNLRNIIGKSKIEEIIGLLSGDRADISLMREIVSGPIDADKQDYLLRDSYFCGVKYGVYDYSRLINTLTRFDDRASDDSFIIVDEDGIHTLEQFILAKYYMTRQVYRHRVRLISDEMIKRGIELGIEKDDIDVLKKLYIYEESDSYLDNYREWWDERLANYLIFEARGTLAGKMFERLLARRLFKKVFSIKIKEEEEILGPARKTLQKITKKENKPLRKKIETGISKVLGTAADDTIINSFQVKSVKEISQDEGKEVFIKKSDGTNSAFSKESIVFQSIDESLNEVWCEVYAPVEYKDNRDRKKKEKEWKREIVDILSKICDNDSSKKKYFDEVSTRQEVKR